MRSAFSRFGTAPGAAASVSCACGDAWVATWGIEPSSQKVAATCSTRHATLATWCKCLKLLYTTSTPQLHRAKPTTHPNVYIDSTARKQIGELRRELSPGYYKAAQRAFAG